LGQSGSAPVAVDTKLGPGAIRRHMRCIDGDEMGGDEGIEVLTEGFCVSGH